MLSKLREATTVLHKEIEVGNLAGKIMDHSISMEDYKLLLLQNYVCYKVVEHHILAYLPNFSCIKSIQLEKDLRQLNVDTSIYKRYEEQFNCNSKSEALGAAYVVEGSVLGGMMIAKELEKCENLSTISEHHFFNGDRKNVSGWKMFCNQLKAKEFTQIEQNEATQKAKETFQFFGKVFQELKAHSAILN